VGCAACAACAAQETTRQERTAGAEVSPSRASKPGGIGGLWNRWWSTFSGEADAERVRRDPVWSRNSNGVKTRGLAVPPRSRGLPSRDRARSGLSRVKLLECSTTTFGARRHRYEGRPPLVSPVESCVCRSFTAVTRVQIPSGTPTFQNGNDASPVSPGRRDCWSIVALPLVRLPIESFGQLRATCSCGVHWAGVGDVCAEPPLRG